MRRLLSKSLRSREETIGNGRASFSSRVGNPPRARPSTLLLKPCFGDHCSIDGSHWPRAPHFFAIRDFNSPIVSQDRVNRGPQQSRVNYDRHFNGRHRRGGRIDNNDNHNNYGDSFSQSYLSHLETRAKMHIQSFHDINSSSNGDSLSRWHRTTVEIIMLMSKLWGKKQHSSGTDKIQLCRFVSLANDLLVKVLMIRKNEVDEIMEELDLDGTSLLETDKKRREKKNYQHGVERETTEVLCQTVALGWSRCDPAIATDAAHKNQAILDMLEDICSKREIIENFLQEGGKMAVSFRLGDVMSANTKLYNHVLCTWSRSLDRDAALCLKRLLDRMTNDDTRGSLFPRPDTISYNNLLNLYANRGDVDAAEALLLQMEDSIHGVTADVYSYSIVMNALQKRFTSRGPHERSQKDPERAEELLSLLVAKYEKSGFRSAKLRPSIVTFGTVISMYAQADRITKEDDRNNNATSNWKLMNTNMSSRDSVGWGAANAERVLDWIIGLNERERKSKTITRTAVGNRGVEKYKDFQPQNDLIRPTARHFGSVMDAWAKAGKGVEGARSCERLLRRLLSLHNKLGYIELRPNPLIFGTVIDAWAKADDKQETAAHAESLLHEMEELFLHRKQKNKMEMMSNIAYNLVIDAWSRRPGKYAAERTESILRRLVSNYQLTNNSLLRPDAISYTGVIKAYVDHSDGGKKALEVLEEMNNQYRDGNVKAKPDNKCLAVAMDACAKNGLASEAESLLNSIKDSEKSIIMFNTIISGYTSEGCGNKAEGVLRRMMSLSEKAELNHCSPDLISYTSCLRAWGNSTSPDRVERARALLDECIRRYQSGDEKCKPSTVIFNDLAEIISGQADGESSVLALLEQMESIGCEPDLISFNILIKACSKATHERKRNALQIAASAYNSLSTAGFKADSITYTGMMHVLLNLIDNSTEKVNAMGGVFRQCCDEGYLNQHMLNIFAAAMPEDDFASITGVSSMETSSLSHLPADWSRNSTRDVTVNEG